MKYLYTLLIALFSIAANAQFYINQTFESPYDGYRSSFFIDTVTNTNNLWQIGKPQKAMFNNAFSYPNAIVTDTLHHYPTNDTSVFYFSIWGDFSAMLTLSFYYKLDIDSLSTATIEVSGDGGANWIDILKEDTTYMFYWVSPKPRFDTSTIGWSLFELNMDTWSSSFPGSASVFPHYRTSDTVIYRFTFISGGDSTVNRDGWMMDNFIAFNSSRVSMIGTVANTSLHISPNPTTGTININPSFTITPTDKIVIYNMQGQQIYETVPTIKMPMNLPLPDGVYTMKYFGSQGVATDRVVIMH